MLTIQALPALKDNYIWLIICDSAKKVIVVDPGESAPVLAWLAKNPYKLSAILVTHHHGDHTHGITELVTAQNSVPVYGPLNENILGKTKVASAEKFIDLEDFPPIQILNIPGHTLGHIAYLQDGKLFCGDTLFSAGCGRLFEGTPTQLYSSLKKLAQLEDDTLVYCGHEYTVKNLEFAHLVEPSNKAIIAHQQKVANLRQQNLPSLPSSIALEKAINPFLRCDQTEIKITLRRQFVDLGK